MITYYLLPCPFVCWTATSLAQPWPCARNGLNSQRVLCGAVRTEVCSEAWKRPKTCTQNTIHHCTKTPALHYLLLSIQHHHTTILSSLIQAAKHGVILDLLRTESDVFGSLRCCVWHSYNPTGYSKSRNLHNRESL